MYRLFTKPFSGAILPVVRKVFPSLVVKDLVSVQPMTDPSGYISYIDFSKCCNRTFQLYEELWLEDFKNDELWCPQIEDYCWIDEHTFREMRWKELVFEDWEVEQLTTYVEGVGNHQKQLTNTGFKAMWFPEK